MASFAIFSVLFAVISSSYGAKCPSVAEPLKQIVCYYEGTTSLENVNLCNCTHLIFTNISTVSEDYNLIFQDDVKLLEKTVQESKNLNLLFSLNLKSKQSSALLKSDSKKSSLINGVRTFLRTSEFSGVEINFEFQPDDATRKEKLVSFVKELSETLDHHRSKRDGYSVNEELSDDITTGRYTTEKIEKTQLKKGLIKKKKSRTSREDKNVDFYDEEESELSVVEEYLDGEPTLKRTKRRKADGDEDQRERKYLLVLRLSITPEIIGKKYDLKAVSKYVDYLIVPTHMITDKSEEHLTVHPSRLMGLSDILNTDSILDLLTGLGAPKSKIIISMPASVLKYQLKDASQNTARSPTIGDPQMITQSKMCSLLKGGDWTVERDEDLTAPYAFSKSTWLAFEDEISANIKGKYVILRELAGAAIYPIDADTASDNCAHPQGGRLAGALQANFGGLARKPRQAVLESLQEQIHDTAFYSQEAGVHLSEYRIVRVVDHSGAVHVIRKNTKTEFECSRQGYFSHPLGCNKFYRCVKFNQYSDDYTVFEYDCPAGLAFDERWEVCVWPGSLPHGAPCTGSSEIAPVPRAHYACPNAEGYYADPENCRWFFACLDHARDGVTPLTAYEFRCPFGLVFDENTLSCEWPWKVGGCGARGATGYVVTKAGASSGYLGTASVANGGASFATIPDYIISGGRIANKGAGVILNQNVAAIPGLALSGEVGSIGFRAGVGSIGLADGLGGAGFVASTPSSLILDNGGSKHREEGGAYYSSTPSSIVVDDGGASHRGAGGAYYSSTPTSFLVDDGGSSHREAGGDYYSSTPSSLLVDDGGASHREVGGAYYSSTPVSVLVDDGGASHRAAGGAYYSSTPASVLIDDGGASHRGQGSAYVSSTPSSVLVGEQGFHNVLGSAVDLTGQLVSPGYNAASAPSSFILQNDGSKYSGTGAQIVKTNTPKSLVFQQPTLAQGIFSVSSGGALLGAQYGTVPLNGVGALTRLNSGAPAQGVSLNTNLYLDALRGRYGVKAGAVSSIPVTNIGGYTYGKPSVSFELPKNNLYGQKLAAVSTYSTGQGYTYDKPSVQLELPTQTKIGAQGYAYGAPVVSYESVVTTARPTVYKQQSQVYQNVQAAVPVLPAVQTVQPIAYQQNIAVTTARPISVVKPVIYQQPAVSLRPTFYQKEIVTPRPFIVQQQYATPKPVVVQQEVLAPRPVVYQQEISPAVTTKPLVYTKTIVTPRPVVYNQQKVVLSQPVLYEQQLVTPKPVTYTQQVVTPGPVIYEQRQPVIYKQKVTQQIVTARPALYAQQQPVYTQHAVTPRPVVYEQQTYVTPRPVVTQQKIAQPIITQQPIVYQQQLNIQPISLPKPVVYEQKLIQTVTPKPVVIKQEIVQPVVTPRPVIYKQPVTTAQPVVYDQQYLQPIVTPRPVEFVQPAIAPQPVIYQQPALYKQPVVTPKPIVYQQEIVKTVTAKPIVYQQQFVQQTPVSYKQPTVKPILYQQHYVEPVVTQKSVVYQKEIVQPIVTPKQVLYQQPLKPVVYQQKYVTPKPIVYQQEIITPKPVIYQQEVIQPIVTPKPQLYRPRPAVYQQEVVTPRPIVYSQEVTPKITYYQRRPPTTPNTVLYQDVFNVKTPQPVTPRVITPSVYQQTHVITQRPIVYEQPIISTKTVVNPSPVVIQEQRGYVYEKPKQTFQEVVSPKPVVYQQEIITPRPVLYQQEIVTPRPVVYQKEIITPRPIINVYQKQQEYLEVTERPVIYAQKIKKVQPVSYAKPVFFEQQTYVTPKPIIVQQTTPKAVLYQQNIAVPEITFQQQRVKSVTPVIYKEAQNTLFVEQPRQNLALIQKTPRPEVFQTKVVQPVTPVVLQQETYKVQPQVQFQAQDYLQPVVVQESKLRLRGKIQTTPRTVYAESFEANPAVSVLQKEILQPVGIVTTQSPIVVQNVVQQKQRYQPIRVVTSESPFLLQEIRQQNQYQAEEYLPPVTEGSISTLANLEIQKVDVTTARPVQQIFTTSTLLGPKYGINENINIAAPPEEYLLNIQSSTVEPITSTRYTVRPRTRGRARPVTTTEASREYLPPTEDYELVSKPCDGGRGRGRGRGKATIVSIGQVDKEEVDNQNIEVLLDKYSGKFGELSTDDKDKFVTKIIKGNGRGTIKVGKEPEVSTVGYEITSSRARPRGRTGARKFSSTTTSTEGYEIAALSSTIADSDDKDTDTADISLATLDLKNLKVKKDKKTVIVVSQVSDANPILIGKLAGQCSCESNKVDLRKNGRSRSGNRGSGRRLPSSDDDNDDNDDGDEDDNDNNLSGRGRRPNGVGGRDSDNDSNFADDYRKSNQRNGGAPRGLGNSNSRRPNDGSGDEGYGIREDKAPSGRSRRPNGNTRRPTGNDEFENGNNNGTPNPDAEKRLRDRSRQPNGNLGSSSDGDAPDNVNENEDSFGNGVKLPSGRSRLSNGDNGSPYGNVDSEISDGDIPNVNGSPYGLDQDGAVRINDGPLGELENNPGSANGDLPVYIGSYGGRKFSGRIKQPEYSDNIAIEAGPGSPGQINVQIYDDNGVPVVVTSTTTIIPEVSPSILLPIAPARSRKPIADAADQLPLRPSGRRIPSRSKARKPFIDDTNPLFSPIPADEIASTIDYANVRSQGRSNDIPNESSGEPSRKIAGAAFDRYGPGGWRGADETLQGSVDCKRPGLFRHPKYCNKFYACNYDSWKKRYTLHVFNCPVHLAYDSTIGACNWPSKGPACADDNLLV